MEKKFYKIQFEETELWLLTAATSFYCTMFKKMGYQVAMTEKLTKKLMDIRDKEPF